jgi:hypothetical protein
MKTNFLTKIDNVDSAVRDLFKSMIDILSRDDIDYSIYFRGRNFDFYPPSTPQEKVRMDALKKKICVLFLNDVFKKLVRSLVRKDVVDEDGDVYQNVYNEVWANILNMNYYGDKAYTTSTVISEEEYEVDEGTSKDLDYDSIYVKLQKKGLSDEEKWSLLLNDIMDKISLGDKGNK